MFIIHIYLYICLLFHCWLFVCFYYFYSYSFLFAGHLLLFLPLFLDTHTPLQKWPPLLTLGSLGFGAKVCLGDHFGRLPMVGTCFGEALGKFSGKACLASILIFCLATFFCQCVNAWGLPRPALAIDPLGALGRSSCGIQDFKLLKGVLGIL